MQTVLAGGCDAASVASRGAALRPNARTRLGI